MSDRGRVDATVPVAGVKCWCCGTAHEVRGADDPWEGRLEGYCDECATNRCDCYPDECPVKYPQYVERAHAAWFAHCDLCMKFRLRVYWWTYCDTSCKRCRKKYGNWNELKQALRHKRRSLVALPSVPAPKATPRKEISGE